LGVSVQVQVQVHRLLSEHTVRIGLQPDPGNGQPLSIGSAKHSESTPTESAFLCSVDHRSGGQRQQTQSYLS
jgi:hypothetical protein